MADTTSAAGSSAVSSPCSETPMSLTTTAAPSRGERERELPAEAAARTRHDGHSTVQQAASVFCDTRSPG